MRDETVGAWLDRLASSEPAPGGGAAAAMNVAVGAALLEMVVNLTLGKDAYRDYEEHAAHVLGEAGAVRAQATRLAEEDARAFTALMAAYRLPKDSDSDKAARREEIQRATVEATRVPLEIASRAARVIQLATTLPGRSNANVLSDVAVAAASARAGLEAAAVNVRLNLGSVRDPEAAAAFAQALEEHLTSARPAEELLAAVNREVAS